MNDDVRKMIDDAKAAALKADRHSFERLESDGTTTVVNRVPKKVVVDKAEIDPSNVTVAPDAELAGMLVAQLIEIRAQKRLLDDRDSAIKTVLQDIIGELEYLSIEDGGVPLVSMKHESSVRLNTAMVRETLSIEEHPECYSQVTSRPLRLMG